MKIHYEEFLRKDIEGYTVHHFACGRTTREGNPEGKLKIVKPSWYYPLTKNIGEVTCSQCLKSIKKGI